jgi:MOSC domain-containing protein YiiM
VAHVERIHVSNGGVPKLPVESAAVGPLGLEGDAHRSASHGGPQRAVCLFAAEVLEALRAEGHPIEPGWIGENLLVRGLDWPAVVPRVRLNVGADVVLEITRYTVPCANLVPAFRDGFIARVSQERFPGWSRVYARVLAGGTIRPGDGVEMLAPP